MSQTNYGVFNTLSKSGKPLTRKPEELPAHVIVPAENKHDLALHAHDTLIGVVQQHSSDHHHRERFHASTPFKKVFKGGERPQTDLAFVEIAPDPKAAPFLMESNHLNNLRFFSVYDDGTPRFALPSDDRLHLEKKRMEQNKVVESTLTLIEKAYESGNERSRNRVLSVVSNIQRALNIDNPSLSQYIGQVLNSYQNNALIQSRQKAKVPAETRFLEKRKEEREEEKKEVTKKAEVSKKIDVIEVKEEKEKLREKVDMMTVAELKRTLRKLGGKPRRLNKTGLIKLVKEILAQNVDEFAGMPKLEDARG